MSRPGGNWNWSGRSIFASKALSREALKPSSVPTSIGEVPGENRRPEMDWCRRPVSREGEQRELGMQERFRVSRPRLEFVEAGNPPRREDSLARGRGVSVELCDPPHIRRQVTAL
jgi:hypothetical protein